MDDSFYSDSELLELGLACYGRDVKISRKASLYSVSKIYIGNHVRIDDFCILSGCISIGNYVHIAAYSALFGGNKGIDIRDFANISSRVCIYALSDDYSGESMTNPTVPDCYRNVMEERVTIGRHVIIGSGSTVLPGADLKEGTAVGAMSLIRKSTDPFGVYVGIPARRIKDRGRGLLSMEYGFQTGGYNDW